MASIEKRKNRYRLIFYHSGRRYTTTLKTVDRREAEAAAGAVERCLMHLQQGVLELPTGADVVAFALSGGRRDVKAATASIRGLKELKERYLKALGTGAIEASSLGTLRIHLRHLEETLGSQFPIQSLKHADLQRHIERRTSKTGKRMRPVGPVTLRKEIASLGACWNWGVEAGLIAGPFPARGLKYPKTAEKAPFRTWEEIEREIARGGLTEKECKSLWDCLFLTLPQLDELFAFVRTKARHGFLYPMLVTAAHTGARRSELLQMRISDLDFERMTLLVREKKRVRGKRSSRRVPLAPPLADVLREWLAVHPGGQYLFCLEPAVDRSKKRGRSANSPGQAASRPSAAGADGPDRDPDRPLRRRSRSQPRLLGPPLQGPRFGPVVDGLLRRQGDPDQRTPPARDARDAGPRPPHALASHKHGAVWQAGDSPGTRRPGRGLGIASTGDAPYVAPSRRRERGWRPPRRAGSVPRVSAARGPEWVGAWPGSQQRGENAGDAPFWTSLSSASKLQVRSNAAKPTV